MTPPSSRWGRRTRGCGRVFLRVSDLGLSVLRVPFCGSFEREAKRKATICWLALKIDKTNSHIHSGLV